MPEFSPLDAQWRFALAVKQMPLEEVDSYQGLTTQNVSRKVLADHFQFCSSLSDFRSWANSKDSPPSFYDNVSCKKKTFNKFQWLSRWGKKYVWGIYHTKEFCILPYPNLAVLLWKKSFEKWTIILLCRKSRSENFSKVLLNAGFASHKYPILVSASA